MGLVVLDNKKKSLLFHNFKWRRVRLGQCKIDVTVLF